MKSVTEFWAISLNQALAKKVALTGEGKTPEEISAAIGDQYKMEGEKLAHFMAAMDVAEQNPEKLSRVRVVTLAEGENAPPKAHQVEAHHYVPEFQVAPRPAQAKKADAGGKGGRSGGGGGARGGGGHGGKTKTSPWGLTPEEKAAKKSTGKAPKHNNGY